MLKKITVHFPELNQLSEKSKRILVDGVQIMTVPAGTEMFAGGSESKGYVMVLDGTIRVQKTSEDGREITLYRVEAGEACVMTTTGLISDDPNGTVGVSETDITLAIVPPETFNLLLAQSKKFRSYVFEVYAKRMSMLLMLVDEVVFRKLDKRLAQILLDKKGDPFEVTHQDLATELGSVREVVSRQLKVFERQGMISLGRGMIQILNRSALQTMAE